MGTKNKGKKRANNAIDDVPQTPTGLPVALRDGKIAGMYVDTPPSPRRSPRSKVKSEAISYIA